MSLKSVYQFTVDATPSAVVFTSLDKAIGAAKKEYNKYRRRNPKIAKRDFLTELNLGNLGAINALVYIEEYPVK